MRVVPKLLGWMTLPEAARYMGLSPQAVHRMVFETDQFQIVRAVGDKPVFVVTTEEVHRVQKRREASRVTAEQA